MFVKVVFPSSTFMAKKSANMKNAKYTVQLKRTTGMSLLITFKSERM